MEQKSKKHLILKILLALLPAILLYFNYALMSSNSMLGLAFLIIWAVMIWSVWQLEEKNSILERFFRLTEIGFFLLPLSSLILTFVFGAQVTSQAGDSFEQAGAAIGTAIGGTFIIIISFIVGITGGIVMHLITNKYEKKAEAKGEEEETFANKHGVIISVLAVVVLAIILGSVSSAQNNQGDNYTKGDKNDSNIENSSSGDSDVSDNQGGEQNQQESSPAPDGSDKVGFEIVNKEFKEADMYSGSIMDQIILETEFENKSNKDMRGIQGVIVFVDMFGDNIMSSSFEYTDGIPKNSTKTWDASIEYNEFIDEHKKLRNTDLEDLEYELEIDKIIYKDGTKDEF